MKTVIILFFVFLLSSLVRPALAISSIQNVASIVDDSNYLLDRLNSVKVQGNYMYVWARNDKTLNIFNITNPASPSLVGVYTDATNFSTQSFLEVSGDYAYIGGANANPLVVVNISNKASPTLADTLTFAQSPWDFEISGNYLYGFSNWGNNCFTIVNITDPTNISEVMTQTHSTCNGNLGGDIKNGYLYTYSTSGSDEYLSIWDISNPTVPAYKSSWSAQSNGWSNANCQDLESNGDYVFCAAYMSDSILAIDVRNKLSPVLADYIQDSTYMDLPLYIELMDNFVIAAAYNSNRIVAIDIRNPYDMSISTYTTADATNLTTPYDITYSGNYIFIPSVNNDRISIYSFDGNNPIFSAISGGASLTSVTILWTTNESSNSTVDYGLTSGYGSSTQDNAVSMVTSHSITLTNLVECTTYHYRVKSTDAYGNQGTSSDNTFKTRGCPETNTTKEESIQIPLGDGGNVSGGVIKPLKDSTTQDQEVFTIIEPKTFNFNAYLSSQNINSSNISDIIESKKSNAILAGGKNGILGIKSTGNILWQIGKIQNIWYKAYAPSGSTTSAAKIIPELQNKPSIIAFSYTDKDLIPPGKPKSSFNPKRLQLAHSLDGVTWKILPTSVVDTKNHTVAALHKIGGYYMVVGR